jgi:GrpB-like predicted nucleotidyltransferase (UPF0157 family)
MTEPRVQPHPLIVVAYDPTWPTSFDVLRQHIWPAVADVAIAIEHVGSTSVPGLAAKPIIDIDVVVVPDAMALAIKRLATIGYEHQGDLGIEGREAFRSPAQPPRHHLYCCVVGGLALRNHLALRTYLRAHPEAAARYSEMKLRLAADHAGDMDAYTANKTAMILELLANAGVDADELQTIDRLNRR